jgi:hypothetical protein
VVPDGGLATRYDQHAITYRAAVVPNAVAAWTRQLPATPSSGPRRVGDQDALGQVGERARDLRRPPAARPALVLVDLRRQGREQRLGQGVAAGGRHPGRVERGDRDRGPVG